jgi:hypothetical protein
MTRRTLYVLITWAALVTSTLACSVGLLPASTSATPTPFPTLTPLPSPMSGAVATPAAQLTAQDVATSSAERMAHIQSFHFVVQLSGTPVQVGALINSPVPITLKHIEGDVAQPDHLQAQITVSSFGIASYIGLVRIGGDTYLNNPLTGGWEHMPAQMGDSFDPSLLFNPERGLPALLPSLGFETVGFSEVQGEIAYHLQAKDLSGIDVTGFGGQKTVTMDVWVGMQSFLLQQATITEVAPEAGEPTVWLLTLSAFDRPVTITPPASQ